MTLIDLLAANPMKWMTTSPDGMIHRVLLWLDPEAHFLRLTQHLAPALSARGIRFFENEEIFVLFGITPTYCFQSDPDQVRKRGLSSFGCFLC